MFCRSRLFTIVVFSLAGALCHAIVGVPAMAQPASLQDENSSGSRVARLASQLGVGPAELLAAGASPADAAQVVANVNNWLVAHGPILVLAEDAVVAARRAEAIAKNAVRRDPSADNRAALASATNSLAATSNHLRAIFDAALLAAVAGLPDQVRDSLASIRTASAVQVPEYLKVVSRSTEEWVALRDAAERDSTRRSTGQPARAEDAALLANAEADPRVVAAKQRLAAPDPGVKSAFDAAIAGLP